MFNDLRFICASPAAMKMTKANASLLNSMASASIWKKCFEYVVTNYSSLGVQFEFKYIGFFVFDFA